MKETIEHKACRLELIVCGVDPSEENISKLRLSIGENTEFKDDCKILELAIAEEREACAKAIENGEWNGKELPEFIRNRGLI